MLAGNGFGGLLGGGSAAAVGAEGAAAPVPERAGTGTEQAAEDARKGPRSRAASREGVLWRLGEGRGGGMLPLLPEFLWGLPRLLSAGSSRESWPSFPRLRMKVRAAQGGDEGKGVGFASSIPGQHYMGPAGGCPLAWQHLPATPHPFQPWDPNPIPWICLHSCNPPAVPDLSPFSPCPGLPYLQLPEPHRGILGGTHQPVPPGSLQAAEIPVVFLGVSIDVVSDWGGDTAAQLPPPFLSPGSMSSPQGHPDGVLTRSEQSVERIGEVRERGG